MLMPVHASPAQASFPGGNGKIVYEASAAGTWLHASIWVADSGGGNQTQLTFGGIGVGDNSPAWSPGGTMIAFTRATSASLTASASEIWVMKANGTGLRRLTNNSADDVAPNWSPDGSRLVFSSDRTGNYEIHSMKIDGSDVRRLTNNAADDFHPNWAPDGARIAWASNRSGNFEIYSMNSPTGSGVSRLTTSAGDDWQPNWSPDGTRIAFASDRTGYSEIFVMNANGGAPTQLTYLYTYAARPSWTPDGAMIVFEGWNATDDDVLLMDADGSGVGWIVSTADDDTNPDWQPIPAFPLVDAQFSAFNADIIWLFNAGITGGCSDERFCPNDNVTRGQMAAFLDRALKLPATTTDYFTDDATSIFQASINRLAAAGITAGCTATTFCPNDNVTRGQMAAFLHRALGATIASNPQTLAPREPVAPPQEHPLAVTGGRAPHLPTALAY
jgi:Tol biopolymer transport system component